jgi:PAS domain S-box-containing protein
MRRWLDAVAYPTGDQLHVYFRDVSADKRESEERTNEERNLRAILDSLPQIAWVEDEGSAPNYLNARWYEYTGVSRDQPFDSASIVHPEGLTRASEARTAAIYSGGAYRIELRLKRWDGIYRWRQTQVEPVRNPSQSHRSFVGTSIDIHERWLALKSVQEAKVDLRLTTDYVPSTVAFVDKELTVLFVNQTFEIWFQVERSQVFWKSLSEVLGRNSFEDVEPYVRAALGGANVAFERWTNFPSGQKYSSFRYLPRTVGKEVVGYFAIVTDLTGRVLGEERFRLFVQAIAQIAWSTNSLGETEFCNDRFYEYTGLIASQENAWTWAEIIHPDDLIRVLAERAHSFELGLGVDQPVRLRNGEGDYRWFLEKRLPFPDQSGAVSQWFFTLSHSRGCTRKANIPDPELV